MTKRLRRFYNYYVSPDKHFVRRLSSVLGYVPIHISYYKLAFSHRNNNATVEPVYIAAESNERLEFLGDSILGAIVAEYLFCKYANKDEGFLTKMRSKIVNRKSMNDIADRMGLDVFLAESGVQSISNMMLGNALEALIGAVYLDTGYVHTKKFVIKDILRNYLDVQELEDLDDNYKSQLLEFCQKHRKTISYELLARFKYDNRDRFRVAVLIGGEQVATAEDFTKKAAEQHASEKALRIAQQLFAAEEDED